jgi:hypothetical protein
MGPSTITETGMRARLTTGWLACLAAMLLLAGCASTGKQLSALEQAQYAWSAAIRWGDFEGALALVDPQVLAARPVSDLELERYRQVQVSQYRELSSRAGESEAAREIEIGIVNRHTMEERTRRYVEHWRYDTEGRRWWLVSGLPDFWAGE